MSIEPRSVLSGAPRGRIDIAVLHGPEAIELARATGLDLYVATGASRALVLSPASAERALRRGHAVTLPIACSIPGVS